ncbi:MAG: tRNA (adenosine(37)-N6)-threonylcarbamoyltransferase complex dimerization subunit type 1 TsaB [Bacillota bacterium]|jgi:tRNA threonylcarbamoyladenosine biosynthesis protein TsaB
MHWIAIESATLVASVAVGQGQRVLAEVTSQAQLTHSERLLPMIDQALSLAVSDLSQIDSVIVSTGPGSFTGLRIGLATAKGLAHPRGLAVYGASTLEALAWQQPEGTVVPLLDARRGQVYAAIYQRSASGLREVLAPTAIALNELLGEHLPAGPFRFVGEGASVHQEQIRSLVPAAQFADSIHNYPRACSLAAVVGAAGRLPIAINELVPRYLRASSAEQKLRKAMRAAEEGR